MCNIMVDGATINEILIVVWILQVQIFQVLGNGEGGKMQNVMTLFKRDLIHPPLQKKQADSYRDLQPVFKWLVAQWRWTHASKPANSANLSSPVRGHKEFSVHQNKIPPPVWSSRVSSPRWFSVEQLMSLFCGGYEALCRLMKYTNELKQNLTKIRTI